MWLTNSTSFQIAVATLLALAVYSLGLSGGFYFDDEWNIIKNQALHLESFDIRALWAAANTGGAGPLDRPIAFLTFALNHIYFGLDPFYFKLINLSIHILCGWAIYALTWLLSSCLPNIPEDRRKLFAFLVLLLWLLHPLNLTTVLYSVQRMAGLSALFCVLSMASYVAARKMRNPRWLLSGLLFSLTFFVFWPLAIFSKENALLLPAYLFIIELTFLKFRSANSNGISKVVLVSYLMLLVLPTIILFFYLLCCFPEWILNGYANRDFSLEERLLTQSRVLFFYVGQILIPMNSGFGLFHDDFLLSTSLFAPWTTAFTVFSVLLAILIGVCSLRKYPVISFGILFFLAAHSMESTIFPLELVHEHRNYLAAFSILFAIAYYLIILSDRFFSLKSFFAIGLVMFFGATTLVRASVWGEPLVHAITDVSNHPESPRANYGMGKHYAIYASTLPDSRQKNEAMAGAAKYFKKSSDLRPSYLDGLFGLLMLEGLEGRNMDEDAYRALIRRLQSVPFLNNNYNYLHAVIGCMESGDCELPDEKLENVMGACQKNPGFSGKHAQDVMERYQRYMYGATPE